MAQYPQGVSTFIPDYQAYQPDFNFTANVLQLKQTQYDQNWNRLNNIYGQLLNAPLTNEESVKKRDNTLNRINFDLQRITGLDLSLDQNVQQATQLFRPLYEDQNLMKDMAWTKNTSFEKALGEGKRISTDKDVHSQYWDDGLRAIDYKIQEFKDTPYDQLTSFGDVKYTPYVNVEMKAMELATKMNYKMKKTTPQGDWMITQKNGDILVPTLQSVFYSALGNDPDIRAMYATQAYLDRKDTIANTKDNPEFGGNVELAEKAYLNKALTMLQKQTDLTRSSLVNEQKTNQNIIDKLEESIAKGTDTETTQAKLEQYKDANAKIDEMLKQNSNDRSLITSNINKTLTTTGGSKLDLKDINQLRSRVDAVMASTFLQADLDKAASDFSKLDTELSYEPNPFSVQRQKFQYDSSLISQRAAAQKDVAYFKYMLEMDKLDTKNKLESGLYEKDPQTGEVKMIPELAEVQAVSDIKAKTGNMDPKKIMNTVGQIYKNDAEGAKTLVLNILDELNKEGVVSNSEMLEVLGGNKEFTGFNMNPFYDWLKENGKKPKGTKLDPKIQNMIANEAMYTTKLEKEMMIKGDAGGDEAQAKLLSAYKGSLDNVSPEYINDLTKRMLALVEKKKDLPGIKNNTNIDRLVSSSQTLDDYADYKKVYKKAKKEAAREIKNRLEADGFTYAAYLFGPGYEMVATPEEFMRNIAANEPDQILTSDGMSWGGWANSIMAGATAGGALGAIPTLGAGFVPGAALGGLGAAILYPAVGGVEMAWNYFSGKDPNTVELANANSSTWGIEYTLGEEYQAMVDLYDEYVDNSLLTSPVPVLHHNISNEEELGYFDKFKNSGVGQWLGFQEKGTGNYTANGAGITIDPGVRSPTWNHFLEIKNALKNVPLDDVSGNNGYVTFTGVNSTPDDKDFKGTIKDNKEIFYAIYNDFIPKASKKGEGLGRFQVAVSPLAGEDVGNGAIVFRLPEEYMKKWAPDSNGEKVEGLSQEVYQDILSNGLTVITDATKLQGISIYRNSYKTPEQLRIENARGEGVTYNDPRYPGYSLNFKTNPLTPNTLSVTQTYMQYDPVSKQMLQQESVTNLSNMGTNIRNFRNRYFTDFAKQNSEKQNDKRRQYERK